MPTTTEFEIEHPVHAVTEKAVLVVIDDVEYWVPRSQMEACDIEDLGDTGTLIVTTWWARKVGLIL